MARIDNLESYSVIREIRRDWLIFLLIGASLLAGSYLYPSLPDRVPSHWNIRGEVDGYSSRFWGAFAMPIMAFGIYFLMVLAPLIDPRRENYVKFSGPYRLIRLALATFFVAIHAIVLAAALGRPVNVPFLMQVGISLLFIMLGNVMGQLRHNYFVGIRTPWTLASEEVWVRTHRVAAKVWVAAGLVGMAGALAGPVAGFIILMAALGVTVVFSMAYSYLLFRRKP